jgi:acetyl esterase/lipase
MARWPATSWIFFRPKPEAQGPIVVFIHGGYWRSFDKSVFSHMARGRQRPWLHVAVPSYTLCPEATIADIIDELRQCCLFSGTANYGRRWSFRDTRRAATSRLHGGNGLVPLWRPAG